MKKYIFVSIICLLFSCQDNSKKYETANVKVKNYEDSSRKTNSVVSKQVIRAPQKNNNDTLASKSSDLLGVWIVSTSETGNASFVLEKNIIYYPETDGKYKYIIKGDSLKIQYDDYIQTLSFSIKGKDTLLLKGEDENHIYYRVKK